MVTVMSFQCMPSNYTTITLHWLFWNYYQMQQILYLACLDCCAGENLENKQPNTILSCCFAEMSLERKSSTTLF